MKKGNKGKIHHVEGKGWYIDTKFSYDGKYLHVFHRWYGTFKQAEADLERLRSAAITKSSPSLYDNFLEDWLTFKRTQVCPSTMYAYRSTAKSDFDQFFSGKTLDEAFSAENVSRFYNYIMSKDIDTKSKNLAIQRFKDMLKHSYNLLLIDPRQYQIADVRTPYLKKERQENKERRCPTDREIELFISCIDQWTMDFYMFKIASAVGMRIGEFLALTPESFDFKGMTVKVSSQYGLNEFGGRSQTTRLKNHLSYRKIPLCKEVCDVAKEYIDRFGVSVGERLFPLDPAKVGRLILKYCKLSGVEPFTFHAFRHHLARKLAEVCFTDEDRIARSNMLGHSPSIDMDVYASHDTINAAKRLISKA